MNNVKEKQRKSRAHKKSEFMVRIIRGDDDDDDDDTGKMWWERRHDEARVYV